jgi:hypothetical protein
MAQTWSDAVIEQSQLTQHELVAPARAFGAQQLGDGLPYQAGDASDDPFSACGGTRLRSRALTFEGVGDVVKNQHAVSGGYGLGGSRARRALFYVEDMLVAARPHGWYS